MKSILMGLMLATSINVFTAKNANAGLIIGGAIYSVTAESNVAQSIGAAMGITGMIATTAVELAFITKAIEIDVFRPLFYISLDVNGEIPKNELQNLIVSSHPYLENKSVVNNLVSSIKDHYENEKVGDKPAYIVLTEEELRLAISPIDLNEEQISELKDHFLK